MTALLVHDIGATACQDSGAGVLLPRVEQILEF